MKGKKLLLSRSGYECGTQERMAVSNVPNHTMIRYRSVLPDAKNWRAGDQRHIPVASK